MNTFSPKNALKEKMLVGEHIVNVLSDDPQLPVKFLPKNWKSPELRTAFNECAEQIHKKSIPYWQDIFE